jgi:hypothetical protein
MRLRHAVAGHRTELPIAMTPPLLVQSRYGRRTTLGFLRLLMMRMLICSEIKHCSMVEK